MKVTSVYGELDGERGSCVTIQTSESQISEHTYVYIIVVFPSVCNRRSMEVNLTSAGLLISRASRSEKARESSELP